MATELGGWSGVLLPWSQLSTSLSIASGSRHAFRFPISAYLRNRNGLEILPLLTTIYRYVHINEIWDRIEKVIYLIVDAILNWYFVRTVKQRLVNNGSVKYNRLVKFNVRIICLSLMMDVSSPLWRPVGLKVRTFIWRKTQLLIIGTMSLKNSFVYVQCDTIWEIYRIPRWRSLLVTCNFTLWPTRSNWWSKCPWRI